MFFGLFKSNMVKLREELGKLESIVKNFDTLIGQAKHCPKTCAGNTDKSDFDNLEKNYDTLKEDHALLEKAHKESVSNMFAVKERFETIIKKLKKENKELRAVLKKKGVRYIRKFEVDRLTKELKTLKKADKDQLSVLSRKESLKKLKKVLVEIPSGARGVGALSVKKNNKVEIIQIGNRQDLEGIIKQIEKGKLELVSV